MADFPDDLVPVASAIPDDLQPISSGPLPRSKTATGTSVLNVDRNAQPAWQVHANDYIARIEAKHGPMPSQAKADLLQHMRDLDAGVYAKPATPSFQQTAQQTAEGNSALANFGAPIIKGQVQAGELFKHPFDASKRNQEIAGVNESLQTTPGSTASQLGEIANQGMQMAPMLVPGAGQVYGAAQAVGNVANQGEATGASAGATAADMAIQGGLMAAMGPIARSTGGAISPMVGKVAADYLGAAIAGGAVQVGNNMADLATNFNPNQEISAGVLPAMVGGALGHGIGQLTGPKAAPTFETAKPTFEAPTAHDPELANKLSQTTEQFNQQTQPVAKTASPEDDAFLQQATIEPSTDQPNPETTQRIQEGMAKPDIVPQRRGGDEPSMAGTPESDRELIRKAMLNQDKTNPAFGRRAADWENMSGEQKTFLQKLREQATGNAEQKPLAEKIDEQTPQLNTPAPESPAPVAPGSTETPKAQLLHPGESIEKPGLLSTLRGRLQTAKTFMDTWAEGTKAAQRSRAKAEFDTAHAVSALKPFQDAAAKMTDAEKTAWVDSMDKAGVSTNPELKGIETINQRLNASTRAKAKEVGLNSDDWRNNYIGFMAKKPAGMSDAAFTAKLGGAENYLQTRKSGSFAEFKAAFEKHGLTLAYDNPVDMIMAKHAEINNSLAWRGELSKARDSGMGKVFEDVSKIPKGWSPLPDRLANDRYVTAAEPGQEERDVNGNKIRSGILAVPDGFAAAINNMYENQGTGKGALNSLLGLGRGIRYVFDTFYAARAATGAATKAVGELLGGNVGGANIARDYVNGRKAIKNLAAFMDDPTTKPLAESLRAAMGEGGFRSNALEQAPKPDDLKPGMMGSLKAGLHWIPSQIQKRITQPLKIGAIIQQHQFATSQGWSPEQIRAYTTEAAKTIDRLYGAGQGVKTLPAPLQSALSLIAPTFDYRTAGIRATAAGVKGLASGQFGTSPAAKALIGKLVTAAAIGFTTQMVATKYNTGTAQPPKSAQDLMFPQTGKKNHDGSAQRIALVDTFTPLVETLESMSKNSIADAAKSFVDPFFQSFAEAYVNRDYRGRPIGGTPARVAHFLFGFGTILPENDAKESVLSGKNVANVTEQMAGFREAPKYIERSEKQIKALDKRYHR